MSRLPAAPMQFRPPVTDQSPQLRALLEASRRGMELPAGLQSALAEAQGRGLLPGGRLNAAEMNRRGAMRLNETLEQSRVMDPMSNWVEPDGYDPVTSGQFAPRNKMQAREGYAARAWERRREQLLQAQQARPDAPKGVGTALKTLTAGIGYNMDPRRAWAEETIGDLSSERRRVREEAYRTFDAVNETRTPEEIAIEAFVNQRSRLGEALVQQYFNANPDAAEQDAFRYAHEELGRLGFQPERAEELRALIARTPDQVRDLGAWGLGDLGAGLISSPASIVRSTIGTFGGISAAMADAMGWEDLASGLTDIVESADEYYSKGLIRPSDIDAPMGAWKQIVYFSGQTAPDLGLMMLGGGAISGTRLAMTAPRFARGLITAQSLGYMGSRTGGDAYLSIYEGLRSQGVEEAEARRRAAMTATVTAVVSAIAEKLPLDEFVLANRANASRFYGAIRGAVVEGSVEGVQELTNVLAELSAGTKDDIDLSDVQQILMAMGAGGLVGGPTGAATARGVPAGRLSETVAGLRDELQTPTDEQLAYEAAVTAQQEYLTALNRQRAEARAQNPPDNALPLTPMSTGPVRAAGEVATDPTPMEVAAGRKREPIHPTALRNPQELRDWQTRHMGQRTGGVRPAMTTALEAEIENDPLVLVEVPAQSLIGPSEIGVFDQAINDPDSVTAAEQIANLTPDQRLDLPPVVMRGDNAGGLQIVDGRRRLVGLMAGEGPAEIGTARTLAYVPASWAQANLGVELPDGVRVRAAQPSVVGVSPEAEGMVAPPVEPAPVEAGPGPAPEGAGVEPVAPPRGEQQGPVDVGPPTLAQFVQRATAEQVGTDEDGRPLFAVQIQTPDGQTEQIEVAADNPDEALANAWLEITGEGVTAEQIDAARRQTEEVPLEGEPEPEPEPEPKPKREPEPAPPVEVEPTDEIDETPEEEQEIELEPGVEPEVEPEVEPTVEGRRNITDFVPSFTGRTVTGDPNAGRAIRRELGSIPENAEFTRPILEQLAEIHETGGQIPESLFGIRDYSAVRFLLRRTLPPIVRINRNTFVDFARAATVLDPDIAEPLILRLSQLSDADGITIEDSDLRFEMWPYLKGLRAKAFRELEGTRQASAVDALNRMSLQMFNSEAPRGVPLESDAFDEARTTTRKLAGERMMSAETMAARRQAAGIREGTVLARRLPWYAGPLALRNESRMLHLQKLLEQTQRQRGPRAQMTANVLEALVDMHRENTLPVPLQTIRTKKEIEFLIGPNWQSRTDSPPTMAFDSPDNRIVQHAMLRQLAGLEPDIAIDRIPGAFPDIQPAAELEPEPDVKIDPTDETAPPPEIKPGMTPDEIAQQVIPWHFNNGKAGDYTRANPRMADVAARAATMVEGTDEQSNQIRGVLMVLSLLHKIDRVPYDLQGIRLTDNDPERFLIDTVAGFLIHESRPSVSLTRATVQNLHWIPSTEFDALPIQVQAFLNRLPGMTSETDESFEVYAGADLEALVEAIVVASGENPPKQFADIMIGVRDEQIRRIMPRLASVAVGYTGPSDAILAMAAIADQTERIRKDNLRRTALNRLDADRPAGYYPVPEAESSALINAAESTLLDMTAGQSVFIPRTHNGVITNDIYSFSKSEMAEGVDLVVETGSPLELQAHQNQTAISQSAIETNPEDQNRRFDVIIAASSADAASAATDVLAAFDRLASNGTMFVTVPADTAEMLSDFINQNGRVVGDTAGGARKIIRLTRTNAVDTTMTDPVALAELPYLPVGREDAWVVGATAQQVAGEPGMWDVKEPTGTVVDARTYRVPGRTRLEAITNAYNADNPRRPVTMGQMMQAREEMRLQAAEEFVEAGDADAIARRDRMRAADGDLRVLLLLERESGNITPDGLRVKPVMQKKVRRLMDKAGDDLSPRMRRLAERILDPMGTTDRPAVRNPSTVPTVIRGADAMRDTLRQFAPDAETAETAWPFQKSQLDRGDGGADQTFVLVRMPLNMLPVTGEVEPAVDDRVARRLPAVATRMADGSFVMVEGSDRVRALRAEVPSVRDGMVFVPLSVAQSLNLEYDFDAEQAPSPATGAEPPTVEPEPDADTGEGKPVRPARRRKPKPEAETEAGPERPSGVEPDARRGDGEPVPPVKIEIVRMRDLVGENWPGTKDAGDIIIAMEKVIRNLAPNQRLSDEDRLLWAQAHERLNDRRRENMIEIEIDPSEGQGRLFVDKELSKSQRENAKKRFIEAGKKAKKEPQPKKGATAVGKPGVRKTLDTARPMLRSYTGDDYAEVLFVHNGEMIVTDGRSLVMLGRTDWTMPDGIHRLAGNAIKLNEGEFGGREADADFKRRSLTNWRDAIPASEESVTLSADQLLSLTQQAASIFAKTKDPERMPTIAVVLNPNGTLGLLSGQPGVGIAAINVQLDGSVIGYYSGQLFNELVRLGYALGATDATVHLPLKPNMPLRFELTLEQGASTILLMPKKAPDYPAARTGTADQVRRAMLNEAADGGIMMDDVPDSPENDPDADPNAPMAMPMLPRTRIGSNELGEIPLAESGKPPVSMADGNVVDPDIPLADPSGQQPAGSVKPLSNRPIQGTEADYLSDMDPTRRWEGKFRKTRKDRPKAVRRSIAQARARRDGKKTQQDLDNFYKIIADLSRRFSLGPPGKGRARILRQWAAGFWRPQTEAIRLQYGNQISTFVHELGHHLHKVMFARTNDRAAKLGLPPEPGYTVKGSGAKGLEIKVTDFPPAWRDELYQLGYELYGERVPVAGYIGEGWAEFTRMLLTDPKTLKQKAPITYQQTVRLLVTERPETWAALTDARVRIYNAVRANRLNPVRQFVQYDHKPIESVRNLIDDFRKRWFDRYQRLVTMKNDLMRSDDDVLASSKNPHIAALRVNGNISGDTKIMLERGTFDVHDAAKKRTGKGLVEILYPVRKNMELWQDYMVAKRVIEKREQGYVVFPEDQRMPASIRNSDLKSFIARTEADHPEFIVASQEFQDFNRWLISDYAVKHGLITPEQAILIIAKNLEYITFRQVQSDDALAQTFGSGQKKFANISAAIRRFRPGRTGDQIIPPLDAFLASMQGIIIRAQMNRVAKLTVDLAMGEGGGRWMDRIDAPVEGVKVSDRWIQRHVLKQLGFKVDRDGNIMDMPGWATDMSEEQIFELVEALNQMQGGTMWRPSMRTDFGNREIRIMVNGKPQFFEVKDRRLFELLEGMHNIEAASLALEVLRVFGAPGRVLRAGATQLNPSFFIPNFVRDMFQVLTMTDAELAKLPVNARRRIEGMKAAFLGGEIEHLFLASGADMTSIFSEFYDPRTQKIDMDKLFVEKTPLNFIVPAGETAAQRLRDLVALGNIQRLNEAFERANRYGEFWVQYLGSLDAQAAAAGTTAEQLVAQGVTDRNAMVSAGQAAADITIDYQRGGTWSKTINEVVVFFNVALLGADRIGRFIKENPAKAFGRMLTFQIVPSLIMILMNYDNDDYWAKDLRERDRYWFFPTGNHDNGRPSYLKVPKPYGLGSISIIFERAFAYHLAIDPETGERGDPRAMDGIGRALLSEFRPTLNIGALLPIIEVNAGEAGYSFFRQRPIVSPSEINLPFGEQGAARSSGLARFLGRNLNYPPAKIDYLIQGFFGGLGKDLTQVAVDPLLDLTGIEPHEGEPMRIQDWMIVRRFLAGNTTGSHEAISRFYDDLDALKRVNAGLKARESDSVKYAEYFMRYQTELTLYRSYTRAESDLREEFSYLKSLYSDRNLRMDADELQQEIDRTYDEIIRIAKEVQTYARIEREAARKRR